MAPVMPILFTHNLMQRIRIALSEVEVDVEMRRVRLVAPGKWMLCAKFTLPQSVAYARNRRFRQDEF